MRKSAQASLAGFLVLWLLYSTIIAASPSLHHAVHDDAGHGSHHCAITLLEKHQVLSSDAIAATEFFCSNVDLLPSLPASTILGSVDRRLPSGRAPPV